MGNIKYQLRKVTKTSTTGEVVSLDSIIYLVYWVNGERLVYPTGQKINPDLWNNADQRAVKRKGRADLSALNSLLDKLEENLKASERELMADGIPITTANLKHKLDLVGGKLAEKVKYKTFVSYAFDVVKRYKSMGKYPKAINSTTLLVQKFSPYITFEEIDVSFHDNLITYMRNEGYAKNYEGKVISTIKLLMNMANEEGHTKSQKYKSARFKRVKEPVYNIYLSVAELEKIHEHEFKSQRLDNACDLFLLGAFTGLRFADYSTLKGVNFAGGEFVIQDTMKVASRLIIPQHRVVKEILAKRDGELPYFINNALLNLCLKKIGKDAGIDNEVIKARTKGGKKEVKTYKKYELITTHTARRSLATNMYLAGIPIKTIMMITGHSSVGQLMEYIKITEQEVASSLQDHPFFK